MKILVVDDQPEISEMVKKSLRKKGHNVETASTTEEAARLLNFNLWDLIISDVMIPKRGGIALIDDVKAANASIPVIMMTGNGEEWVKKVKHKADAILLKPFSIESLLKKIKDLTGF